jgi:hypothetical protein
VGTARDYAASAAIMKAASISSAVLALVSATGKMAGMTAAIDWPAIY